MAKNKVYQLPKMNNYNFSHMFIEKIAVYVKIQLGKGKSLGLYNVHLENTCLPSGRLKQALFLLDEIEKNKEDIIVLGGDFNTWFLMSGESALRELSRQGYKEVITKKIQLDRIFVKNAMIRQIPVRGKGSDHQPLLSEINIM